MADNVRAKHGDRIARVSNLNKYDQDGSRGDCCGHILGGCPGKLHRQFHSGYRECHGDAASSATASDSSAVNYRECTARSSAEYGAHLGGRDSGSGCGGCNRRIYRREPEWNLDKESDDRLDGICIVEFEAESQSTQRLLHGERSSLLRYANGDVHHSDVYRPIVGSGHGET